jgi:cytochrome c-type biogenesis protein CcmH|tara:strand:- start:175 stop:543 length:369 start_codon:yes stop_codon:yes gene_type:complete
MKILKIFLAILITLNFTQINSAENNEELKNKISKNIRCLICQGQSIYDSQSDFALSMKLVINKKLDEGLSENEIYEFLKNQYGQWITYDPELNQKTFILWVLPILLFLIGGAIIIRKLIVQK